MLLGAPLLVPGRIIRVMTDNMPFDWENMCQQHKEPEIMQKSIEVPAEKSETQPNEKIYG